MNIHPEIFREVLTEFRAIHERHPEMDGVIKWRMAKDWIKACALADTKLWKELNK